MSTKRKALRYGLKKQELGLTSKKQSLATSMKLLRSVAERRGFGCGAG